jgi:hypothetical protein
MSAMRKPWHAGVLALLVLGVAGCAAPTPAVDQQIAVEHGGPTSAAPVVPAACPAKLPSDTGFPAVDGSTLVPGTPTVASVCRYAGMNDPHPAALQKSAVVTGTKLAHLVATMNTGKPGAGGTFNCPADFGLADVVQFGYPSAGPVDVMLNLSGCRGEDNGRRKVNLPDDVQTQVAAVVGVSAQPHG